jgi:hypothetical protein
LARHADQAKTAAPATPGTVRTTKASKAVTGLSGDDLRGFGSAWGLNKPTAKSKRSASHRRRAQPEATIHAAVVIGTPYGAAIVAIAIRQILSHTREPAELLRRIEQFLRDEIADLERQISADRHA